VTQVSQSDLTQVSSLAESGGLVARSVFDVWESHVSVLAGDLAEFVVEYPCHAPDEQRWFRLRARPMTVADETRLLVVHDDVTDRTQLQHDVRARSLLLDQIDAAVIATDLEGRIELWSRAAEHLYDWSADEDVGRFLDELLVPVDADGVAHDLAVAHDRAVAVTADGVWEGELTVARADGSRFPAHVRAAHIHDEVGAPTGMVVVSRDITERRARVGRIAEQVDQAMWLGRIRHAFDTDGFVLYAQPIFDVRTGEVVQHELLIRMRDPHDPDAIIPPRMFLPVAERFAVRAHELGCRLALDDFGTGYGGFTYLEHLHVDDAQGYHLGRPAPIQPPH